MTSDNRSPLLLIRASVYGRPDGLASAANQVFRRLDAVICQFRFDPILKVHLVPDFQEAIRSRFPGYQPGGGAVMLELTEGHLVGSEKRRLLSP